MRKYLLALVLCLYTLSANAQSGTFFFPPSSGESLGISEDDLPDSAQDGFVAFVTDAFDSAQMFFRRIKGQWLPWLPKSVQDFGAVCDGVTDDSEEFQAAANAGGIVHVWGPGTCMVHEVTFTKPTHWIHDAETVVKLNLVSQVQNSAIYVLNPGSQGSIVEGGLLHGDRDTWWPAFPAGQNIIWSAIRATGGASNLTLRDLAITEFVRFAIYIGAGHYHTIEDIRIDDSGQGLLIQNSIGTVIRNVRESDIGFENNLVTYQHANEIRDCDACTIDHISIERFSSDDAALDPIPTAFIFERMQRSAIRGLFAYDYTGTDPDGALAAVLDNFLDTQVSNVSVRGYHDALSIHAWSGSGLANTVLDGGYVGDPDANDWAGIEVRAGGLNPQSFGGDISQNFRSVTGGRNNTLTDVIVQRYEIGVLFKAGDFTVTNLRSHANVRHGVQLNEVASNSSFPGAAQAAAENLRFFNSVTEYNGHNGLKVDDGVEYSWVGGSISNNGQNYNAASNTRCTALGTGTEFCSGAQLNEGVNVEVSSARVGDSQGPLYTGIASFVPGTTTSARCSFDAGTCGTYQVSLINPNRVHLGQRLLLKNATGAADLEVLVKAFHDGGAGGVPSSGKTWMDVAVVETVTQPATFGETSNLTSLTGTFTSGAACTGDVFGTTLCGVAGGAAEALDTEIVGRTWIKADSEYREILRVNGAGEAVLATPFTAPLSADTVQKLLVNIDTTPSQEYAAVVDAAVAGPVSFANLDVAGVKQASPFLNGSTGSVVAMDIVPVVQATITAATTMSLPLHTNFFLVDGTTATSTINGGWVGRIVTFEGPASGSSSFTQVGNIRLPADDVLDADDSISMIYNGTNWLSVSANQAN